MYLNPSNQLIYSPSDLVLFMRSPFASWMDRLAIDKPDLTAGIEIDQDPMMMLLSDKGNIHELEFLNALKKKYGSENIAIVTSKNPADRFKETLDFMKAGYSIIYQAYLQREGFAGSADFLVRTPGQSDLGDYHYEAWDTKLVHVDKALFSNPVVLL